MVGRKGDPVGGVGPARDVCDLRDRTGRWFLEENVLAGGEAVGRDGSARTGGRADRDRVDLRGGGQHFTGVSEGANARGRVA